MVHPWRCKPLNNLCSQTAHHGPCSCSSQGEKSWQMPKCMDWSSPAFFPKRKIRRNWQRAPAPCAVAALEHRSFQTQPMSLSSFISTRMKVVHWKEAYRVVRDTSGWLPRACWNLLASGMAKSETPKKNSWPCCNSTGAWRWALAVFPVLSYPRWNRRMTAVLVYRLEKVKTLFGFQHGKWGEGDHMWIPNHHAKAEDKDSKVYFRVIRGWLGIFSFFFMSHQLTCSSYTPRVFNQTMTVNDSHCGAPWDGFSEWFSLPAVHLHRNAAVGYLLTTYNTLLRPITVLPGVEIPELPDRSGSQLPLEDKREAAQKGNMP